MPNKDKTIHSLLKWYKRNKRKFLWRRKNISLYKLLACEIFLWKTQAKTVASFTGRFFKKYSSPLKIEKSSIKALKNDIKKLGLVNRRSKQLKNTFTKFSYHNVPQAEEEFRKRYRVGQYIARSVLAVRYSKKTFPVDENIRKFFKCLYGYDIKNIRKISKKDEKFLGRFIQKGKKEIIWAIIDLAAISCKTKQCVIGTRIIKCYPLKMSGKEE